ncbi:tol-pal system protein YbgF [Henriciella sp.]|uniref:tol-pal system protein YbgF n=1 Tax=Henriciella sp. TaxID=1968823 RepID=UPI00262513E0|nr:tol-pal system protein YbgF [Henriciella sp.]
MQRGTTSGGLSSEVASIRQQNADLRLEVSRLQNEVNGLNGKIETLEFLLSQSRDEAARLQEDDARIGSAIESLDTENERLDERVKELEADLESLADMVQSRDVAVRTGEASDAGQAEDEAADEEAEQDAERSSQRTASSSAGEGRDPDYQGSLGTLQASNLPGEAGPLFADAKTKLLNFDFEGAENAFRAFLEQFGDDPQAGEAQYWLAEALFQQEAYAESGQAYTKMIRTYPDHSRAPDALVKLARSMRLVGDMEKACNALSILPEQYPDASGVTKNLANLERTRADCDA